MSPKSDDAPSLVLMRFANLAGALVVVTATEHGHRSSYTWQCTGCLAEDAGPLRTSLNHRRTDANDHAAVCRALPQPERENA